MTAVVRAATSSDMATIVALHAQAFPTNFMSLLGERFLRCYYELTLSTTDGILLVAVAEGETVGFAAGSTRPGQLYAGIRRQQGAMFLAILPALVRRPTLCLRLLQRYFQAGQRASVKLRSCGAELASLAVSPKFRGRDHGTSLVLRFGDLAHGRGRNQMYVLTPRDDNRLVITFYERLQFTADSEVGPPSRPMLRLVCDLARRADEPAVRAVDHD